MILNSGKKADQLRILGLKEQQSGAFPGFSFWFVHVRLEAKEAGNLEMSRGAQTLLSLAKEPEMENSKAASF